MDYLMLDTETTDLVPGQIAQLSYIVTDDKLEIIEAKNYFFRVDQMSRQAQSVHGLSLAKLHKLAKGRSFAESCKEISQDFGSKCLVSHNMKFDLCFLTAEFGRRNSELCYGATCCTMELYTSICRIRQRNGRYKWPRLDEVLRFLYIDRDAVNALCESVFHVEASLAMHDARFDASAVYLIYKHSMENGLGITSSMA